MAGTRGQLVDQWRPVERHRVSSRCTSPPPTERVRTKDDHPFRARTPSSYRSPPRYSSRRRTRSRTPARDDEFQRQPRPRHRSPSLDRHRAPLSHRYDSRSSSQHRLERHRLRRRSSSVRSASRRTNIDKKYTSRNPSVDRYRGRGVSGRRSPDLVDSYAPSTRSREILPAPSSYRLEVDRRYSPSPQRVSTRKHQRSRSPATSRKYTRRRVSRSRSRELPGHKASLRDQSAPNDLFSSTLKRGSPSSSYRTRETPRDQSPGPSEDKMRPSYAYTSRGGPPRTNRGGHESHHSSSSHPPYPPPAATAHGPSPYWSHPPHTQAGSPPPPFPPPPHSPFGHTPSYFPPPPVPPPIPYGVSPPPIPPPFPSTNASHGSPPYPPKEAYRGGYDRPYERERAGYGSSYPPPDRRASGGSSAPYRSGERPSARARGTFSNLSWTPATGSRGGKIEYKGRDGAKNEDSVAEIQSPVEASKDQLAEGPPTNAPAENRIKFEFKSKVPPPPVSSNDFPPPARAPLPRPPPPSRYDARDKYPSRDYRENNHNDYRDGYREDYHEYHDDYRDGYRDDYRDRRDYRDDYRERDERHYGRRYSDRYAERYDERAARYYERPSRDTREPTRHHERFREPRPEPKLVKRMKERPILPKEFAESESVYFRKPGNESVVGSGTYGKVFKAIHVYTGNKVALKKIRMEGERDGFPITAIREVKLLQSLNHANVVRLQEVMVERNDCYMVFEYLSHDLTGLLNHPSFKLEQHHKKDLAKQLFTGLDYLHRRGVLHRDIKAANILVSNTGQLKLADFGLARFFAKRRQLDYTNRVITIWYRSPELLLGETQYGPAVDIWSAACVLCEIFTKHAIFPGDGGEINQLDRIYAVLGTPTRTEWPAIVDTPWFELLRPSERKVSTFADKYADAVPSPAAFELLKSMFAYDPAKRPDAGAVLQHAYFTQEEPRPQQATELEALSGDWHEFESKALRKERERVDREARRAQKERDPAGGGAALESEGAKLDRKRSVQDMVSVAATSDSADADGPEREAKRQKVEDIGVAVPPPPPPAKGDEAGAAEYGQGDGMGSAPMSMRGS